VPSHVPARDQPRSRSRGFRSSPQPSSEPPFTSLPFTWPSDRRPDPAIPLGVAPVVRPSARPGTRKGLRAVQPPLHPALCRRRHRRAVLHVCLRHRPEDRHHRASGQSLHRPATDHPRARRPLPAFPAALVAAQIARQPQERTLSQARSSFSTPMNIPLTEIELISISKRPAGLPPRSGASRPGSSGNAPTRISISTLSGGFPC
jgi:hypothetical protein